MARRKPYILRNDPIDVGKGRKEMMESAYSKDGVYIGDRREAYHLWRKYGIEVFEPRRRGGKVCNVGYSPRLRKWFGWSHRAIASFATRSGAAQFAGRVS